MSKYQRDMEDSQQILERTNDQGNAAAKSQPAKKVPDRNAWTRQQLERSNKQFEKAKREGKF